MKKILNTIIICVVVVVLAFAAGYTGSVILLTSQKIHIPFVGKVNIEDVIPHKNVVIERKEQVYVNNDIQLQNVYKNTQNFVVYIAEKNKNDIYKKTDIISKGFVFTTDGWIFTNNQSNFSEKKNYVVILNDGKVYDVKNIMFDKYDFAVLKIENQKMLVSSFVPFSDINIGSEIIINKLNDGIKIDHIVNKNNGILEVENKNEEDICLFDLSGKIVGIYGKENGEVKVYSTEYLKNIIYSINSKSEYIKRPNLDNISFSEYKEVFGSNLKNQNGIIIEGIKGNDFGFKKGDLIISVDNVEVSNNMNFILQKYNVGDKVKFTLIRNDKEVINTIVLE